MNDPDKSELELLSRRLWRLEAGLADIKQHCGHVSINAGTSTLGGFVDLLLQHENGGEPVGTAVEWTDEKNERRCELIDIEVDGGLTPEEQHELETLQNEMLAYRKSVAPLPIDKAKEVSAKASILKTCRYGIPAGNPVDTIRWLVRRLGDHEPGWEFDELRKRCSMCGGAARVAIAHQHIVDCMFCDGTGYEYRTPKSHASTD